MAVSLGRRRARHSRADRGWRTAIAIAMLLCVLAMLVQQHISSSSSMETSAQPLEGQTHTIDPQEEWADLVRRAEKVYGCADAVDGCLRLAGQI